MHKVIKGWSNFQAAWFTDIELLEQVYRVTHDSAGIVHAFEGPVVNVSSRSKRKSSMPNLANDHYSVVMQPVGLRGADAMPQNEAQLARAAHGCLHGLQALHQVTLWIHLVLLCSCGPSHQLQSVWLSISAHGFFSLGGITHTSHADLFSALTHDTPSIHICLEMYHLDRMYSITTVLKWKSGLLCYRLIWCIGTCGGQM